MKIRNCTFERWADNHTPEHKDRIFRELYPYNVFRRIDFSPSQIDQEQFVEFNNSEYYVKILNVEFQDNGRYRTTFQLKNVPKSKVQGWKSRTWNEKFQIVYSVDYEFITVFTKNEDSSKDYIKKFYKSNFQKITENKSLPISDLLFRTLISTLCDDLFKSGKYYQEFDILPHGHRQLPKYNQFLIKDSHIFAPFYSKGRELWVCHSFNEEKAHRVGFHNGNQCDKLFVIYCNPTYTKHHRCNFPNVHILSLFEFAHWNSREIARQFDPQIRFLQNHLNAEENHSLTEIRNEIENPTKQEYTIYKSELMEALGIMKILPNSSDELFHYLTSMNLLNAWIGRSKKDKKEKLFADMYFFKTYLAKTVEYLVVRENFGAKIFLDSNLAMIEFKEFQFSFHHIPMNVELKQFMNSKQNVEIKWGGKRLQPIAPLLFRYSKLKA